MFLNPVLSAKTYLVLDANDRHLGEINADNVDEAFREARALYWAARVVRLKNFVPSTPKTV